MGQSGKCYLVYLVLFHSPWSKSCNCRRSTLMQKFFCRLKPALLSVETCTAMKAGTCICCPQLAKRVGDRARSAELRHILLIFSICTNLRLASVNFWSVGHRNISLPTSLSRMGLWDLTSSGTRPTSITSHQGGTTAGQHNADKKPFKQRPTTRRTREKRPGEFRTAQAKPKYLRQH